MGLTGHCNCGGVRFEIDAPLSASSYCHCTRCQRRTGAAASANGVIPPGALRIVAGEELIRAWQPEDGFAKEFCSACGSHLFSQDPAHPERRFVRLGVVDGDPGIRPTHHHHVATAAVWEPLPDDGLPRYPDVPG
jgi:hypothetical protein